MPELCTGEIYDVWIAKQVVEKRLDGCLGIGAAQLEEDDGDSFKPRHNDLVRANQNLDIHVRTGTRGRPDT